MTTVGDACAKEQPSILWRQICIFDAHRRCPVFGERVKSITITRELSSCAVEVRVTDLLGTAKSSAVICGRRATLRTVVIDFIVVPAIRAIIVHMENTDVTKLPFARLDAATATRWTQEGNIFGVCVGGQMHYPAFQFLHGEPRLIIARMLAALRENPGWPGDRVVLRDSHGLPR